MDGRNLLILLKQHLTQQHYNMEATKVKLKSDDLGEQSFDIEHAQRVLNLQVKKKIGSWVLSDDKFELKDGIITLRNKADSKKAKEQGLVGEGGVPSEQA